MMRDVKNNIRTHTHTFTYKQACSECSLCNAGEYIALDSYCTGATFTDISAGKCRPCRASCPSGQYLTGSCVTGSEVKDRTCLPCTSQCPAGQYALGRCDGSTTYDTRKCVPCGFCQPGQYQVHIHTMCVCVCVFFLYSCFLP